MLSKKPWRLEGVLMFFGALFMSMCVANILAVVLHRAGVHGFKDTDDFGFVVCATLGVQGVTWLLIPIFLKWNQMGWREAFGLNRPGWVRSLGLAAGTLALAAPVVWGLQFLCAHLLIWMGHPPDNEKAVEMFLNLNTVGERVYFDIFAVVLAPVAEEFIFRGVLYPFIKQLGWPRLAFIGVSGLFALIHLDLADFVPLFALALLLTWLYEKTDCLLAPIAAHSLFNAVNMILLYISSQGQDVVPLSK
jgi:membrane protease YdiL (CAAX protease family)